MKVGILVDATCDIPSSILNRHHVNIIPTHITAGSKTIEDSHHSEITNKFYKEVSSNSSLIAHSTPNFAGVESFNKLLTNKIIYQHDNVLIITPHIALSSTQKNIREALLDQHSTLEELRRAANINRPFKVRIVECKSSYAGYGLVLYEALRLINEKGRSVDQIKQPLESFTQNVETYVIPGNQSLKAQQLAKPPFHLNWVALQKHKLLNTRPLLKIDSEGIHNFASLSHSHAENEFLNLVYDQLTRTNLSNHLVNISYAGNLSLIRVSPSFRALHEHVKAKHGKLVYSEMSPTSAVQLGIGALSVSFAGGKR